MKVESIPTEDCVQWILNKHYAHRMPCVQYAFGLFEDRMLSGVVTFGPTPTPAFTQAVCGGEYTDKVFELNRLCVDTKTKNASSFLVGGALRLLPRPLIIVSYADEGMGHKGYIYQATNFLYTGAVTAHDSEYMVNGVKTHARSLTAKGITAPKEWADKNNIEKVLPKPKHRYLKFLGSKKEIREMMNKLTYPILDKYPKGETARYDASQEIPKQGILF